MVKWWVGFGLGASLFGCGSSHAPPAINPADECDDFFEAYCGRYAACAVQAGVTAGMSEADAKGACMSKQETVTCDKAVGVSPTYNACLAEIKTLDCDQIILAEQGNEGALPTDCQGAIRVLP